ncbi:MAG: NAD-glutamate dehydrogenase domain-containing protein, partial [Alphaproteobacteria bacterium]
GVFDRKVKSITLTAEMKKLVGLSQDKMTPDALIRAILTAKADLLWFGGIGTFVKASSERHIDADDRTNDSVRVDARELRCRVIGEGANLGVTEFGRIEAARNAGCKLNSDAIDNSAGVDTSDHEVNIKILLRGAVDGGSLTMKTRDVLLQKMTAEVAGLVLRDNYLQTQALSIAEARGVELLDAQTRLMRGLERSGRLDRKIEFLPNDETLDEYAAKNCGLTRPECAVLLAYGKIDLYDALLDTDLPDDAVLLEDLKQYFPAPLRAQYAKAIACHPLRRELIATGFVNAMVNCVGPTFVNEIREKTGQGAGAVARAYAAADGAFAAHDLLRDIEALDNKVDAAVQTEMMIEVGRLVERSTYWFLRNTPQPLDIAKTIAQFRPGIEKLAECLADVVSPEHCDALARNGRKLADAGVPRMLAGNMASLDVLISGCDVVCIAGGDTTAVKKVAECYFALGTKFGLDWLRTIAQDLDTETHWEKQLIGAIVDELFMLQSQLTSKVFGAGAAIEAWTASRENAVKRVELILDELRAVGSHDLAMLGVATRELRLLITG